MYRFLTWTAAIVLAVLPSLANAQNTWMTVVLDGRKIGHLHITESREDGHVLSTSALSIDLTRVDKTVNITNTTRSTEDAQGQPLAFSTRTNLSSIATEVDGTRLPDGRFKVTSQVGGLDHERIITWPQGAVMQGGQRRIMREHGLAPGTRYQILNFDPATQLAVTVDTEVLGTERVSLPDGERVLHHLQQRLHLDDATRSMNLWVDDDYRILKGSTQLLGFTLEMLACSRECALAPNQSIDLLSSTMVDSPRPLPAALRMQAMRYLIEVPKGEHIQLITTSEQRAQRILPGLWQVDVGFVRHRDLPGPSKADTAPTDWLQSTAPLIVKLAKQAVGDARSDRERVQRMNEFVHRYISEQGLSVGYASALEAAKTRAGDCTEHAVLLAAMARSQGIPARVVSGLAFADRYSGHTNVFVPHAWVQAWVKDHWQSYDPTLGHFDSAHIALAIGDGDPWRYFSNLNMLGKMHIRQATLISDLINTSEPPPTAAPSAGAGRGGMH